MSDLVPFILSEEVERIKNEIDKRHVSITFDGTSRLGEALVIVVRFIDDWNIKQRLIGVHTLVKSITGEETAREVLGVLCREFKLVTEQVLAAMRDRASVNAVAIRHVKVMFPNLLDIGCYSHHLTLLEASLIFPLLKNSSSHGLVYSPTVQRLGLNGKVKQVDQWHFIVKPAGGAGGRFSIRLCSSLETCIHSCKSRLSFLQPQGTSFSRSWQTP